jgi:hypothetical protein
MFWTDLLRPYNSVSVISVEKNMPVSIDYLASFKKPERLLGVFNNHCSFVKLFVYDSKGNSLVWEDLAPTEGDQTKPPGDNLLSIRLFLKESEINHIEIRLRHSCGSVGKEGIVDTLFDRIQL